MYLLINTVLGDVGEVYYAEDDMHEVTVVVIERTPARADHPLKTFSAKKVTLDEILLSIKLNKETGAARSRGGYA